MSEDLNEIIENEVVQQDQQSEPEKTGHLSKEDWEASGRDPKEWRSKEVYEARGEWIKEQKRRNADHEQQIRDLNMLHKAQLTNTINDLISRRDDAIDIADRDAVKRYDKQIKDAENQQAVINANLNQAQQPIANPEVVAWEKANSWIYDNTDPRSQIAQDVYNKAIADGLTPKQALREINDTIKEKFSQSRGGQQVAEAPRSSGKKDSVATVAWKDLSKNDIEIWNTGMFATKEAFLKAVANDRKGAR